MQLFPCIPYKEQTRENWNFLHEEKGCKESQTRVMISEYMKSNPKKRGISRPLAAKSCTEVEKAARDSKAREHKASLTSTHFPDNSVWEESFLLTMKTCKNNRK